MLITICATLIMKIYTKTGDGGTTSLHTGKRVSKTSIRVEAYGAVDEMNSIVGLALAFDPAEEVANDLKKISATLFSLGSDLATPLEPKPKFEPTRIGEAEIEFLEKRIDYYTEILPELKNFILPGGSKPAAFLHQARTVCRRAERATIRLAAEESVGEFAVKYLNRLSDYFFTAARAANFYGGKDEIKWQK